MVNGEFSCFLPDALPRPAPDLNLRGFGWILMDFGDSMDFGGFGGFLTKNHKNHEKITKNHKNLKSQKKNIIYKDKKYIHI